MIAFIARQIMLSAELSLLQGQAKYRAYFVNTNLYVAYQAGVNTILETTTSAQYPDGYGECIVTE